MNVHIERACGLIAATAVIGFGAWTGIAAAQAQGTVTVELPRCAEEDGSDLLEGHCAWIDPDTGDVYINEAPGYDNGAYVAGFN